MTLVAWLIVLATSPVVVQQDQGTVAGRVTDPSGGVLRGARVTATWGSTDFGTIRSTVSTPRQMQFGLKFTF